MPITRKPTPRRTRLPSLNPTQLQAANERIDALPVHASAKQQLKAMLGAAANPDNERPDVVLRTLGKERQQNAALTQQAVGATLTGTVQRGGLALAQMDEATWQKLVDEANGERQS